VFSTLENLAIVVPLVEMGLIGTLRCQTMQMLIEVLHRINPGHASFIVVYPLAENGC